MINFEEGNGVIEIVKSAVEDTNIIGHIDALNYKISLYGEISIPDFFIISNHIKYLETTERL